MPQMLLHRILSVLLATVLGFQAVGAIAYVHEWRADGATDSTLTNSNHDHTKEMVIPHCPDGHVCALPAALSAPMTLAGNPPATARFLPLPFMISERMPESLLRPPRPAT